MSSKNSQYGNKNSDTRGDAGGARRLQYNPAAFSPVALLILDAIAVLLAASFGSVLYVYMRTLSGDAPPLGDRIEHVTLIAFLLAPLILYDNTFGYRACRGTTLTQIRAHVSRLLLLFAMLAGTKTFTGALDDIPAGWLVVWIAGIALLTASTRILMSRYLHRLQQRGGLTEAVAVVGAGPVADRLIHALRQARPEGIELLGVFDDKVVGAVASEFKSSGTIAHLLELGKTRKIDWIVMTLPPTAEQRLLSIVCRLKALSVPIGLCPQHVGLTVPYCSVGFVGDDVPVSVITDYPVGRMDALFSAGGRYLPRWVITAAQLAVTGLDALRCAFRKLAADRQLLRGARLSLRFDNYDVDGFADVAAGFGQGRYGYVVTPNADHIIRLSESVSFRALYAAANYVLLDSRFLAHVVRSARQIRLPVCAGSDLTAKLFSDVFFPDDALVLIGGSETQAQVLRERYGLRRLAHFNPPMGFIGNADAVEACLRFVERHSPFRFCLLAVGSPQQEMLAHQLKVRGIARGLTLCVGASIDFITGQERRAPQWMRRSGLEWLYRLSQSPTRMAKRYLVRGPRVFGVLLRADIGLRKSSTPRLRLVKSAPQLDSLVALSSERSRADASAKSQGIR